ncbi:MAG: BspA family leucine-rich repeat surface protein [Clostridia bacterium]|nr:BspA family leucine-rich repeat surface protein [Clostridia bacterium]
MKNNRGSLTMTAFFTMLIFSLYGILLYARSASAYNRQTKSIEKIQQVYAQDVPNAVMLAEQLGATTSYDGEYYAITIDLGNGSEVTTISLMPGELVSKPATPVKEGYGFEGWYYINSNGVEEEFDFTIAPTSSVNIYAKYTGEAVMMARNNSTSFWQEEYRTKITSIRFIKDEIPTNIEMLDDLQVSGAARIGAYVEDDGEGGLALTVVSPNTIYANSDAGSYFSGFNNVKTIELSNFKTNRVDNFSSMFLACNNLKKVDVSGFETQKAKNMFRMFDLCYNLEKINVENFDTSNVTDMGIMFSNCQSLKKLDVSHFDTSKVTNMAGTFFNCKLLNEIDITNFNTSNVNNMSRIFGGCSQLTSLNLTNFSTNNVKDMSDMFSGCNSLTSLNVSTFNTSNATNMGGMFGRL